ncbi:Sensor histidine kinase YpdA [Clostridiales bacterium CHKCI001]|nr:Sensor histidine kinase YpdA [Clostridiales bacterium CHKCI001]
MNRRRGGILIIKGKETHKQNRNHVNRIYWKMFVLYTAILFMIVICLEGYFFSSIRGEQVEQNTSNVRIAEMEASNYIQQLYSNAGNIEYSAYQVEDIQWFLEDSLEVYLEKKINNYTKSMSIRYYGIDNFVSNLLESESRLESISFLSNANQRLSSYMKDGKVKTSYFETWEFHTIPNKLFKMGQLVISKNFYDQNGNRSSIGNIIMNYNLNQLNSIAEKYENIEIAVFNSDRRLLFATGDEKQLRELLNRNEDVTETTYWENYLKSYIELNPVSDCWVISYIPRNMAASIQGLWWVTLVLIGIALFAMGELFVHLYLKKLTDRLYVILEAMRQASEGKLDVHVDTPNNKPLDELDIIAENFNQMCQDMDTYIQKSYLAEIEQRNAELCALQSQINPHFLYNTLEVIRMKAICNGDREVGRMLYSLAVIFRSQIKEADIITIAKELHYCKKYLELFEYRYHNKFSFEINCPEALMEKPVIKFVVQPIIENYFVHGIRLESNDNLLMISVYQQGKDIIIYVCDNGKGMTEEEVQQKNEQLKSGKRETGSIGIQNVHIRMRAAYGDAYGVSLKRNEPGGICVMLRFPGEENKNV